VTRLRLALLLLAGACSVDAAAAAPPAAKRGAIRFECVGGQVIDVRIAGAAATVRVSGTSYSLSRRPSSIGVKFISPTAALMIDGTFAAFVADSSPNLRQCRAAQPVALK
jgi:hypothetical protein